MRRRDSLNSWFFFFLFLVHLIFWEHSPFERHRHEFFFFFVLEQSCQNNLRRRRVESRKKIPVKILYSLWWWSWRNCIFMYICQLHFTCLFCFFFFAETSPGVQFVTASLGNVVTEKDNIYYNSVICPEDAQKKKKKSSCCVQHGLWMFLLLLGLQKWSKTQFCHCCSVYVEYEYCVLLESRKRRSKKRKGKKKSNNFQLPVCVFSRSVLISQKWSLSPALSASIFV